MIKTLFDLLFSILVLVILSPILIIVTIVLTINNKGAPFYIQKRVGKDEEIFKLIKFNPSRVRSFSKWLMQVVSFSNKFE